MPKQAKQILLRDPDTIILSSPYVAEEVVATKRVVGAKWNKLQRVWEFPVTSLPQLRDFAKKFDYHVDPSLSGFTLPEHTVGPERIELAGDNIEIYFSFDEVKIVAVRRIIGASWKKTKWTAPLSSTLGVLAFAHQFKIEMSEAVRDTLESLVGEMETESKTREELSRAEEGAVEVEGFVGELLPYQQAAVAYAVRTKKTFIADEPGLGKGGRADDKVLTPTGWRAYRELQAGDFVVGSDGLPTKVTGVFRRGMLDVFRVSFNDGFSVVVDGDHLWTVRGHHFSKREPNWMTLSTRAMYVGGKYVRLTDKNLRGRYEGAGHYLNNEGKAKWQIPMVQPVQFTSSGKLSLDPYLLGLLLGDGGLVHGPPHFTSIDLELHQAVKSLLPEGVAAKRVGKGDPNTVRLSRKVADGSLNANPLTRILRELGLYGHKSEAKFIPEIYKFADIGSRLSLLQGLMDTDGDASMNYHNSYSTSSLDLANDVAELVQSLGGIARIKSKIPTYKYKGEKKEGLRAYRVSVKLPSYMIPFRLQRKIDAFKAPTKYPPARFISKIEPEGRSEVICISVEAQDLLYVTEHYVVTHNTIEAIASLEKVDAFPAVVSCPPSLVLNWQKEIERFTPHRKVAVVRGRKDFPEKDYDYLIIGDANLIYWQKELKGHRGYVFDESHRFKNFDAKRTKTAIQIAKSGKMVLLLTGTPITNRPSEYASQLHIIGKLNDFGGKWGFYKRYTNAFQDNFGQWNISGASNLEELNKKLRGNCYIRRTKEQVLNELAEVRRERLWVEPDPAVMKEYREAEADIASFVAMRAAEIAREIGESPRSAAVRARIRAEAAEHLVRLGVLRRLAALSKIASVTEWIEGRVVAGDKVVVAAHHRDVVDQFAERFGNYKIQGGMKTESVEKAKEEFQEGEAMVMVLSIQAGGLGHTLTASQELAIVELPWVPSDVEQVEGRLHRMGQKGSVLATTFIAQGTIDEQMIEILDEKARVVKAATEGEEVKQLSLAGDLLLSFLD